MSYRDITYYYAGRIHYPSYATTATILSTHKARRHGLDINIALKRPNMVVVWKTKVSISGFFYTYDVYSCSINNEANSDKYVTPLLFD